MTQRDDGNYRKKSEIRVKVEVIDRKNVENN